MNELLTNIYEQPTELKKVLESLLHQNKGEVEAVAQAINSARRIVLTSMGSAYYSLFPMFYYLKRKGYNVWLEQTSELLENQNLLNSDDICILMSRSGESYEVALLPSILKEVSVKSISITMTPDSTMARTSDVVLVDECSYDNLVCTKAYSSMALCGLICAQVAAVGAVGTEAEYELNRMFDWMEENKKSLLEKLENSTILRSLDSYYCLSRGYGIGVIESASLWLEEESKKCCHPSTIDNYYHGPIEVIQTNVLNIFLDTDGNMRSEKIWNCVCDNTDKTVYIGPEGKQGRGGIMLAFPAFHVEKEFNMILLALFFQLLSYQCTVAAGRIPGEFNVLNGWVVK